MLPVNGKTQGRGTREIFHSEDPGQTTIWLGKKKKIEGRGVKYNQYQIDNINFKVKLMTKHRDFYATFCSQERPYETNSHRNQINSGQKTVTLHTIDI